MSGSLPGFYVENSTVEQGRVWNASMNRMELALCSAPLSMEGWVSPVGGDGMYVMVTFR